MVAVKHADVDRLGAVLADAHDHLLLQHAQELDLQVERHLADLVEEDGAAVGRVELARLVGDGAGERALDVTEQLRLEQVLGNGAAVDGDERPLGARRAAVHLARDELLAGAGLAGDEHRDVGGGDLLDLLEDLLHRRARADDVAEAHLLELLGQELVVELELVDEQRVADDERRLRGEDGQHLEVRLVEQLRHRVVADVEGAEQVAALEQRHAHHRRQLERHDAHRVRELLVVQRVGDDDRLLAS